MIRVGGGHVISNDSLLMEFVDPSPLLIAAVAVSSGEGVSGDWVILTDGGDYM